MYALVPYFTSIKFTVPIPFIESIKMSGFGIAFGCSLIVGNAMLLVYARREGLDREVAWRLIAAMNVCIFLGSSIAHGLLYSPQVLVRDATIALDFRRGLASTGAIALSLASTVFILRKRLVDLPRYADGIAFAFAAALPIGRIGCILNHEHLAGESSFFLARLCRPVENRVVNWPESITPQLLDYRFGACRLSGPKQTSIADYVSESFGGVLAVHDLALYEALFVGALFGVLVFNLGRVKHAGVIFATVVVAYSCVRFLLEFLRSPVTDPRYFALTAAQWGMICLMAMLSFSVILVRRRRGSS